MLGVVALALAETAVAEVLLAVLMASILIVWAVELMDHAGILPGVGHRTGLRYWYRPVHRQPPGGEGPQLSSPSPPSRSGLPAAIRGPQGLHSRPDEQPECCADDHAGGDLGASGMVVGAALGLLIGAAVQTLRTPDRGR